jgi:hypothetical protein
VEVERATGVEREEERVVLDSPEVAAMQRRNPIIVLLDSLHNLCARTREKEESVSVIKMVNAHA